MTHDLVVLFEHPEWQKPLFAALERRGVRFAQYDLNCGAFDPAAPPAAPLYFNQASPYVPACGATREPYPSLWRLCIIWGLRTREA